MSDSADLQLLSDEELAALIRRDRSEAAFEVLLARFEKMIRIRTRRYDRRVVEREELQADARLAIWRAALDYRPERNTQFRSFAWIVVENAIVTALRSAYREKRRLHATALSLAAPIDEDRTLEDLVPGDTPDPAQVVSSEDAGRATIAELQRALTPLEFTAVACHAAGLSYEETARRVGRGTKSVDNALQRARMRFCPSRAQAVRP